MSCSFPRPRKTDLPPALWVPRAPSFVLTLVVVLAVVVAVLMGSPLPTFADGPGSLGASPPEPPRLVFQSPPGLEGRRLELEGFDRSTLVPIMELIGLDEPGPPIRIVLAEEGSQEARRAPSWSIAYAIGNAGLVVLMPTRVPTYPDGNLDQVLRHEIAHVLIDRAAGRHGVPRWFHEGVAILAAREWRFEDRSRLVLEAFRRRSASMSDVELEFSGGTHSASRAYAVSAAFVRYLQEEEGSSSVARILDFVAEGQRFRFAFREATGKSLTDVEAAFWDDFDFWNRWVPFITSSTALWMGISFLAVLAWRRRKLLAEERMQAWDEEERERERMGIERQIIQDELRRLESRDAEPEPQASDPDGVEEPSQQPPGGWVM